MTEETPPAGKPESPPPVPPAEAKDAGSTPIPPPPAPPAEPTAPVDWETRFKYLYADFENFRRRTAKEREQLRSSGEAEVLSNLLPILEGFEKARQFVRDAPVTDPVRKGMELLAQEWDAFLNREGLRPIARITGRINSEDFDIVAEAFGPPGHPPGTVLEIVQQGYRFKGGLLRPAKVLVARAPPKPTDSAARAEKESTTDHEGATP